jgi:rhomboid protease GluP
MIARIPAPAYRWHDELEARAMVQEFLADDRRYSDRLQSILTTGRRRGESFEQLAGRIESDVALEYRDSFEELAGVDLDSMAPSVKTLEILKNYALVRGEAVQSLAEGVRLKDGKRILEALEQVKKAPLAASGASTAPATP